MFKNITCLDFKSHYDVILFIALRFHFYFDVIIELIFYLLYIQVFYDDLVGLMRSA